jgi:Helix-turn-helix domain
MTQSITEKLQPYQSFESAADMLRTVDSFIQSHRLTQSALKVLRFLAGRSKVVPGASWLRVETIANHPMVGVTDRTVRRAIRLLEELGIIEVHPQLREAQGGSGANVYVIKDQGVTPDVPPQMSGRENDETPCHNSDQPANLEAKKVSSYKKSTQNICSTIRTDSGVSESMDDVKLDKSYTPHMVPEEFRDVVGIYFNDAIKISDFWHRAVLACKKFYNPNSQVPTDIAVEAFKQTVQAYKRRKIRGEFTGYYWGVLAKMFATQCRREAMENAFSYWEGEGA